MESLQTCPFTLKVEIVANIASVVEETLFDFLFTPTPANELLRLLKSTCRLTRFVWCPSVWL